MFLFYFTNILCSGKSNRSNNNVLLPGATGERDGLVVESLTPEREVGVSIPYYAISKDPSTP